jgi:hypothetical protein
MEFSHQFHAPTALNQAKSCRYLLKRALDVTHIRPVRNEELKSLDLTGNRPAVSPSGSPVTVATGLSQPPSPYEWLQEGVSSDKFSKNSRVSPKWSARAEMFQTCCQLLKDTNWYVERNRTFSDNALWAVTSYSTRLSGVTSRKTVMGIFTALLACNVTDLCKFLPHLTKSFGSIPIRRPEVKSGARCPYVSP